jgi:hypothetical protein
VGGGPTNAVLEVDEISTVVNVLNRSVVSARTMVRVGLAVATVNAVVTKRDHVPPTGHVSPPASSRTEKP